MALAAAGHPVYAPDNRGFGGTDKPRMRISRELLADDVLRFMDALGLDRAALAGHDWGGIIAFKTAIDNPDRISRLALLDTLCTVWVPFAVHGYWFKAEPLPEAFFAEHAQGFIEALFGTGDFASLGARPDSPWGYIPGSREPKRYQRRSASGGWCWRTAPTSPGSCARRWARPGVRTSRTSGDGGRTSPQPAAQGDEKIVGPCRCHEGQAR